MEIIQSILIQPAVKVLLSYATSKTKVDQEYDLYIHLFASKKIIWLLHESRTCWLYRY